MAGFLWSCVPLALFLVLSHGLGPDTGPTLHRCAVDRSGLLTGFRGSTVRVSLPCKYHLADITCGKYRVKVTPGNAPLNPENMHVSPVTMWVKIAHLDTNSYLKVRTSVKRLQRFHDEKVPSVWKTKEGNLTGLDLMGYQSESDAIVLQKRGVFDVTFTAAGDVSVMCDAEEFTSRPVPDTLCGNGTDSVEQSSVNNIILNDQTVTQSKSCKDMAAKFQTCDVKTEALTHCDVILNDPKQAECLSKSDTPLGTYYTNCLTSVCHGDAASALEPVKTYVTKNCAKGFCEGLNYKVLDDYRRDVNSGEVGVLCDRDLYPAWYRFYINGTNAIIPTGCVSLTTKCGGSIPLWARIPGGELPAPGQETAARACGLSTYSCCDVAYNLAIRNCGDFYVYKLTPPAECGEVYCATL